MTQLRPRLTSACGSPWVATTRPSLTATITPQPVPQKRQGALDHLQLGLVAWHHDVGGLGRQGDAGHGGGGRGGLALMIVAAGELHGSASLGLGERFDLVEDQHGRQHAGELADAGQIARRCRRELSVSSVTTILPVSLAPWTSTPSSADRAARTAGQRGRPGMDEQARDVQLSRHGATPRPA